MAIQGMYDGTPLGGKCDGAVTLRRAVIVGTVADSFKMPTGANQDTKAIALYTRSTGEHNSFAMSSGAVQVEAGAALSYGARVYADANGKAIPVPTGTTGTTKYYSFGWNKSSDVTADGDIAVIQLEKMIIEA